MFYTFTVLLFYSIFLSLNLFQNHHVSSVWSYGYPHRGLPRTCRQRRRRFNPKQKWSEVSSHKRIWRQTWCECSDISTQLRSLHSWHLYTVFSLIITPIASQKTSVLQVTNTVNKCPKTMGVHCTGWCIQLFQKLKIRYTGHLNDINCHKDINLYQVLRIYFLFFLTVFHSWENPSTILAYSWENKLSHNFHTSISPAFTLRFSYMHSV